MKRKQLRETQRWKEVYLLMDLIGGISAIKKCSKISHSFFDRLDLFRWKWETRKIIGAIKHWISDDDDDDDDDSGDDDGCDHHQCN